MSDSSLAVHQSKAALEEAQNISTTSSLHIILPLLDTEKPTTYQADTDVSKISE